MRKTLVLWRFLLWRLQKMNYRNYILLLSIIVGVAAGCTALILKTAVFHIHKTLLNDLRFDFHNFLILIYPTIGISLAVFMKRYVIRDSIKHNITSILHAISRRNSMMKKHKVFSSMLGGIITSGFGGSIGLESPIISSGSAIGSNLGRLLHLNYKTTTLLLACGASGAMAAIFNTPIAAIVFVFEVLLIDLTRFSLIPLLLSSVSGAITTKVFFDEQILFNFTIVDNFKSGDIPYFMLLGIFMGFFSLFFTRTYLYIEKLFEEIKLVQNKIVIGAVILGFTIFLFPALYGEGFATIKAILSGNYPQVLNNSLFHPFKDDIIMIILFFICLGFLKVCATATTIGSGGIGGIFAPSLFTGATFGFLFAFIHNNLSNGRHLSESNFALVGMASMLGGVIHAPLTGIFLIAEITSGYQLIVPLMLSTTISYLTIKYLEPNSIITMQLAHRGELITHHKDKAVLSFMQLNSIIETDFKTINKDSDLGDLVGVVAKSHRNLFPVLDKDENLVGLVTLDMIRDIMFDASNYNEIKVSKLMKLPPTFILQDDTMDVVMKKFNTTKAWNLPVVNQGRYIGFVSKSKMLTVYRKLLVDISEE